MKIQFLIVALVIGLAISTSIKTGDDVTVAGISSGAYMAVQMHVANSASIRGSAVFAGGPYYCAQGQITKALTSCMSTGSGIDVSSLESTMKAYASSGKIDSTDNLNNARSYIFAGTSDTTVNPKVDKIAEDLYQDYNVETKHVYDLAAGHTMPTKNYGNTCTLTQSPYIGNCDYDGAFESLNFLFSDKLTENVSEAKKSNIFSVAQKTSGTVMGSEAFIYVPEACQNEDSDCSMHVVFHGCLQTIDDIEMQFVENTGYNDVAEANNLVILYPQATKDSTVNPLGCWDWWGYTGANYATNDGKQISEIYRLIDGLKNGTIEVTPVYKAEGVSKATE